MCVRETTFVLALSARLVAGPLDRRLRKSVGELRTNASLSIPRRAIRQSDLSAFFFKVNDTKQIV